MPKLMRLIASLGLLWPVAPANAQHPLVLDRLNALNGAAPQPSREILEAQVRRKAKTIYADNPVCSASPVSIESVEPATADRYVFKAAILKTLRNAWFVVARQSGCDDAPIRYMVMQNADNSFRTIRVNRGVSYAWDSLISDTLPLAKLAGYAALLAQGITCSELANANLGVFRIASEEKALGPDTFGIRYSGSWSEIWPIELCNRTVEVFVTFTADGDGGAYSNLPSGKARTVS